MHTKKILIALEVVVVFLVLTIYLWLTIHSTQKQKQSQALDISASQLKNGIESFLSEKVSILLQVRNFWMNSPSVSHEQFSGFCRDILGQTPGFQAIEYGDASNRVVWVEPFLSLEPSAQSSVASEPVRYKALQRAILKRNVSVTPALDLSPGVKGFFAFVPIFRKGKYDGTVVGVFKLDALFSLTFDSVTRQRYNILVQDGETPIYSDFNSKQPWNKSHLLARQTITMPDQSWSLFIWPREEEAEFGFISSAVLILGIALSFALGTLVWSLSRWTEQSDLYVEFLECSTQIKLATEAEYVYRLVGDSCKRLFRVRQVGFYSANDKLKRFDPAWCSAADEVATRRFYDLHLHYGAIPFMDKLELEKKGMRIEPRKDQKIVGVELLPMFRAQNLALVPLIYRGELKGLMFLDYALKSHLSNREFAVIEAMALEVALVLANIRLNSQKQAYADY
ncbi:MAG: CHASE domain-containing protein [Terriglobia bacterium]